MRELEDLELALKVVIVGNGAVGKSSMIQRYCKGTFTKDYKKTIGVDFLERTIEVDGEDVRLMLWDTAGQEEFDAITKAYYRGAQACVLAFSTTDRASFLAVKRWKKKVEDECGDIPMVLVQNKIDLLDQAAVLNEETEALARELKLRLYRTSVKENVNVDQVFRYLADLFLSELHDLEESNASEPPPCHVVRDVFGLSGVHQHSLDSPSSPTSYSKVVHNGRLESTIKLRPHKMRTPAMKWNSFRNNC